MHALLLAAALAKALGLPVADQAPIMARSVTLANGGITCAFMTQREVRRSAGRNPRALHFVLCLDDHDGSVVGAMLRKNGAPYCDVNGTIDPATLCGVMNGCGLVNQVVCA